MRRILVCCTVMFLAGCKCGGPPGALGDVLGSYCKFIDRCPDQVGFPIAYRNQAECVDILNWATTCRISNDDGPNGEPMLTIEQVTPNIDPVAAAACETFLATASCDVPLTGCDPDTDAGCNPCSLVFANSGGGAGGGTGGSGGAIIDQPCANDTDCRSGLYCINSKATADGGETCRVCKPLRAAGGDCVNPPRVPCGAGLYCDYMGGSCLPKLPAGMPCPLGAEQCSSGFCNPNSHVCDPGGNEGNACVMLGDCRQGYCDATTMTCSRLKANGEACTASMQCLQNNCDMASQKCGKPDGAMCNSSYECQGVCDTTARLCKTGAANGTSCTNNDVCNSKLCHSQQRVCVKSCSDGCAADQFCDSYGSCQNPRADGAQCDHDDECTSDFCNDNGNCATKPGIGGACGNYGDCLPKGYCSGGTCTAFARPGDACTAIDSCAPPFICTNGKCELMNLSCQPAKTGQQCASLLACDDQSYCDPLQSFTCVAKKPAGGSCLRSVECGTGFFCNRTSRTCVPHVAAGQSCDRGEVCSASLFCDESVDPNLCSTLKSVGASCQNDTDCVSRDCEYTGGSGSTCQAPCVPVTPGDQLACIPAKCSTFGFNCGSIDGGCGEAVYCGQCNMQFQTCGGGGQPQVCGCTPSRGCNARQCNTMVDNGCGVRLDCNASCDGGMTCGGSGTPGVCACASDRTAGPGFASMAVSILGPGTSGGFDPWDNVDKLFAEDDAGAHVHIDTSSSTTKASQFLLATGFGFNLPPTASVNGISAEFRRRAANGTSVFVDSIMVWSGGKAVPTSAGGGSIGSAWGTTRAGSTNDLWNYAFTPAEINAPDFGIGFQVRSIGPSDTYVDSVKVTVHYAYRCDCRYSCKGDSECGSDGCGGFCPMGAASAGCDAGRCVATYCNPQIYTDPATGLQWSNDSFDVGNCATLTLGGLTGWRVPTIDELRTRIVGCPATGPSGQCAATSSCAVAGTCLDAGCEGCEYRVGPDSHGCYLDKHTEWIACTGGSPFFSSTATTDAGVYTVDFATGGIGLSGGSTARYRCVRGP